MSYLDRALKHGDREVRRGHSREVKSEFGVKTCAGLVESFDDFLQPVHPRFGQMAILEEHPVAVLRGGVYQTLRHRALTLTQRNGVHPVQVVSVRSKSLNGFKRAQSRTRTVFPDKNHLCLMDIVSTIL